MPRLRSCALVLACALLAGAAVASPALGEPDPATVDCTSHNHLTRQYSATQLQHALATLSADVKEYTSCPDVLQRALDARLSGLHASGGSGSGGGSFLPTPLLVLLIVLLLVGAGFGALQLRRSRSE